MSKHVANPPSAQRVRISFPRLLVAATLVTILTVAGGWAGVGFDHGDSRQLDGSLVVGTPLGGEVAAQVIAQGQSVEALQAPPTEDASPAPVAEASPSTGASSQPAKRSKKKKQKLKPQKVVVPQQDIKFDRLLARAAEIASLPAASFRVATLNVLGASHTSSSGNRKGFASGAARMGTAVGLIRARGIDVIGFQEFEDPQYATFARMTGGEYGVYPGRALGPKSIRFSIAWRLSEWSLVSASSVGVPYAGGSYINMPYVLLRNNASGRQVYFANFHNPADTRRLGNNGRWRAIATSIEIALVNRLRSETGFPVVLTGDFNDRAGIFCPMTTRAPMRAAAGGSTGPSCAPPSGMQVDWIFGTTDMSFSGYTVMRAAPVPRITDHALVYADAYIGP